MSDLPKAVHSSELQIAGLTLRVHVLNNGQRVIDADSVAEFFRYIRIQRKSGATTSESDLAQLARWLKGEPP